MRPSLALNKSNLISDIVNFFNPDYIENVARETGFVQRKSMLNGFEFFIICVFGQLRDPLISLNSLCCDLLQHGISISKQSLHDRFNKRSVEFIRRIVGEALSRKLSSKLSFSSLRFDRIIIGDSTSFQLPPNLMSGIGSNNNVKMIQYRYNVLNHEIIQFDTQTGFSSDANYPLRDIRSNDLIIEDLGYFKLKRLEQIEQSGAYYLSRLRFDIQVYADKVDYYEEIDLLKIKRKMRNHQISVLNIFLGKELLPARLIIQKVPKKIADEKRRKLKSSKEYKHKGVSQKRLELCDINAFITNAPEDLLPCAKVRECYSLRWQIEIIFKSWKSVFSLNVVKSMNRDRFECLHYGCLILIILSIKIACFLRQQLYIQYKAELSELKAYKAIAQFFRAISYRNNAITMLQEGIDKFIPSALKICIKEARMAKRKPLQILEDLLLT